MRGIFSTTTSLAAASVIAAGLAEFTAIVTANEDWRTVAVGNVRAGAVFAVLAALAGWLVAMTSRQIPCFSTIRPSLCWMRRDSR